MSAAHALDTPELPELLVGWKAIGDALGVAPEVAMRWRLEHRLPVVSERVAVGTRGHTIKRVRARRAELLAARALMPDDAAPPLPRLRARRLLLGPELLALHFPELAGFEPRDVSRMVAPHIPYRIRLRNLVVGAPLLSKRQKDLFGSFLDRMPDRDRPADLWVDMLTVSWFADLWGECDRSVQRQARELVPFGVLAIDADNFRRRHPGVKRTKRQCANVYSVPVISCAMLELLGYRLTPAMLAAIADLDASAAARVAALSRSSAPAPAPAAPSEPKPRPRAPPAPKQKPATVTIDDEILLAIMREPRLAGALSETDLAEIHKAHIGKGLRVEETLAALWYTLSRSDRRGRALFDPLLAYLSTQKPVTNDQVVQAFLAHSPMRRAAEDVGFVGRLLEDARGVERPLLGADGVLDVLRAVEAEGYPADGKDLRRLLRTRMKAARSPPE